MWFFVKKQNVRLCSREKRYARKREKCRVNLERENEEFHFTTFTTTITTAAKTHSRYSPGAKDEEDEEDKEEDDAIIIDDDDLSIS